MRDPLVDHAACTQPRCIRLAEVIQPEVRNPRLPSRGFPRLPEVRLIPGWVQREQPGSRPSFFDRAPKCFNGDVRQRNLDNPGGSLRFRNETRASLAGPPVRSRCRKNGNRFTGDREAETVRSDDNQDFTKCSTAAQQVPHRQIQADNNLGRRGRSRRAIEKPSLQLEIVGQSGRWVTRQGISPLSRVQILLPEPFAVFGASQTIVKAVGCELPINEPESRWIIRPPNLTYLSSWQVNRIIWCRFAAEAIAERVSLKRRRAYCTAMVPPFKELVIPPFCTWSRVAEFPGRPAGTRTFN